MSNAMRNLDGLRMNCAFCDVFVGSVRNGILKVT